MLQHQRGKGFVALRDVLSLHAYMCWVDEDIYYFVYMYVHSTVCVLIWRLRIIVLLFSSLVRQDSSSILFSVVRFVSHIVLFCFCRL